MRHRRGAASRAWLPIALAACGVAVSTPALGVTADPLPEVGIRLVDAPTARADDPRARLYIVDQVKPGAAFSRRVEVINGAAEQRELLVYAAPATIADGEFVIGAAGGRSELVDWVTVSPERASLGARGRTTVRVDVRVPESASEGEYYGAVVAERPAPTGPGAGGGVGVALRAGIRIYLSVGPGGEPASDFRMDSLQAVRGEDGRPAVLAQVENTGGRALDLAGELRLSEGPGGLSGGPFPARLGTTLAPGQTAPVTVPLDAAISGGPWLATLTLKSGLTERRAEARITFPDAAGASNDPVPAKSLPLREDPRVLVPIAAGLIAVATLLGGAAALSGRLNVRRPRRLTPGRNG